jgi:hypothetical protein
MWMTRTNLTHRRPSGSIKRALALLSAAALAGSGCTAAYVKDSTAAVQLFIAAVNGGAPLKSDVRLAPSAVVNDSVPVDVAVRAKNPNFDNVPQIAMAVFLERYEVSYYRSDGRAVEGVDVPYRISGNLTVAIDALTSGTTPIPIDVVRAQAKLEPPLVNLWGPESGTLGGTALIVTMFARITLHGRTVPGQAVQATGTLQIDFADYPDDGN